MKNRKLYRFPFFAICVLLLCFIKPAIAQIPADLMNNCKQWKITYPNGVEDKTLCTEPNNEFFYVNGTGDAIVFRTPIRSDNESTPNSDNIRSELRERTEDGTLDISWTTTGTHLLYVKQAITHLPIKNPQLVASQIHGNKDDGIDDAMIMRLEGTHLFLSFNGGKLRSNVTIKTNYVLGTVHEVIFKVVDGKHYCYYAEDGNLLTAYKNGTASSYLIKADGNDYVMDLNYDQTYFKVGNYTQSNPKEEGTSTGDPNNYGEVLVYNFFVEHSGVAVSNVALSPKTVNLTLGSTQQLSITTTPTDASNQTVSYSSSNPAIATVSDKGVVTAVAIGTAIITVTTADGGFTDTSTINVIAGAFGPNLALKKPITATGTPDGSNIASNLVDGYTSTRWAVSGFPQTATIDLGKIYNLERTELVCYSDRAYKFTVSVSDTENGTYTKIVDRSANTTPGTENNPIIDLLSGISGRFIKLTATGASGYTGSWVSLTEFRVFEAANLGTDINFKMAENLVLWPNPVSNTINISGTHDFKTLTVCDMLGKILINQTIQGETVDVSHLDSGIYMFSFSNKSQTITKRVIIK